MPEPGDVVDIDVPRFRTFAGELRAVAPDVRGRTPDGALTETSTAMPRSYLAFSHGQVAIGLRKAADALAARLERESGNVDAAATRFVAQEQATAAALAGVTQDGTAPSAGVAPSGSGPAR